jgi:hypothetical protein
VTKRFLPWESEDGRKEQAPTVSKWPWYSRTIFDVRKSHNCKRLHCIWEYQMIEIMRTYSGFTSIATKAVATGEAIVLVFVNVTGNLYVLLPRKSL